jgi:hypothetical protein
MPAVSVAKCAGYDDGSDFYPALVKFAGTALATDRTNFGDRPLTQYLASRLQRCYGCRSLLVTDEGSHPMLGHKDGHKDLNRRRRACYSTPLGYSDWLDTIPL